MEKFPYLKQLHSVLIIPPDQDAKPALWYAENPPPRLETVLNPFIFRILAAMLARWPPLHMTIMCLPGSSSRYRVRRSCHGIRVDPLTGLPTPLPGT